LKPLIERVDLKSYLTSFPYKYSASGDVSAEPNEIPHMTGSMLGDVCSILSAVAAGQDLARVELFAALTSSSPFLSQLSTAIPDFTTTRRRSQKL
jgi:hypothetical protein